MIGAKAGDGDSILSILEAAGVDRVHQFDGLVSALKLLMEPARPVEHDNHWLVALDSGWGCDGCDWTSAKMENFWQVHERRSDDIPF